MRFLTFSVVLLLGFVPVADFVAGEVGLTSVHSRSGMEMDPDGVTAPDLIHRRAPDVEHAVPRPTTSPLGS